MVFNLSSEVLKGYPLFLIYKTNIFVQLLKLNLMPMWLYFFIIYLCGIWAFSSSRKHLLITLLRLEFVVLVLYFSSGKFLWTRKSKFRFRKKKWGNSYPAEEMVLSQEGILIFYVPCMASNSACVTEYSCTKV